jgi:hypothetical protein
LLDHFRTTLGLNFIYVHLNRVSSQIRVPIIRVQEDWAIARECWKLWWRSAIAT